MSYVRVEANNDFVILGVADLVFLYGRRQVRNQVVNKRLPNLRSYELLPTGNLLFFYDDHAENFKIQIPLMIIHPSTQDPEIHSPTIVATSVEFN